MADSFTGMVGRYDMQQSPYASLMGAAGADYAFRTSPWYGKILTIPVDDAVREWRAWQATADEIEAIEAEERRLSVQQVVRQALTVARHQGGALIMGLGLPGAPDEPLRARDVKRGDLTRLVVLGRNDVVANGIDRDPLSDGYGLPTMWRLTGAGEAVHVHPSRTVLFQGAALPGQSVHGGELWGVPLYDQLGGVIRAAERAGIVMADLLEEAKLDVVTVPGMVDMLLSAEGEAAFMRRWDAAARLKDYRNVLLLDGGPQPEGRAEVWDQKELSWGGLPEVARTLLTIMAGAADIPVTRLTGEQQAGLSGADSGSLRNYYDAVAARQKLDLGPAVSPLDEWLIWSALGDRPKDIWYRWNPLYQMDEKEMAEIDKLQADTAAVYAQNAMVDDLQLSRAVANRMIESGRWPGVDPVEDDMDWPGDADTDD